MKCPLVVILVFFLNTGNAFPDSLSIYSFNDRFHHYKASYASALKKDSLLANKLKNAALKNTPEDLVLRLQTEFTAIHLSQIYNHKEYEVQKADSQLIDFISMCEELGFEDLMAYGYFLRGGLYWERIERLDQAVIYFDEAYQLVHHLDPDKFYLKQNIIYSVGEKFYYLTDYQQAINYLKEAADTYNPKDSLDPFISIYNTMGLAYRVQNKLKESEECFLIGLSYAERAGKKVWTGILRGNMGNIAVREGDIEKAKKLLHEDKEICLEVGARNPAAGALLELAKINISEGNMALGEAQLDSALEVIKYRLNYRRKKAYYPLMSKIKAYKGDAFASALYLDSALMVSDSLTRLDNSLQMHRLNQRIGYQEAKAEIVDIQIREQKRKNQLWATLAGLLLSSLGGFFIYRQKTKTDKERKRSDELLLNILPEEVANELKSSGAARAKRFDPVTVLFSDFKDFTKTAAECSPEQLVKQLDEVFSAFDDIVQKWGLEKIKTIGDAYLCVGGLPKKDNGHAQKVVECALEMMHYIESHPSAWKLRIGIHTGPVVAGIVGKKKFAYDIWGDAVNTSARMEQKSVAGAINISKATYKIIRDDYICDYRGKIKAKGKGALDMYFVKGRL